MDEPISGEIRGLVAEAAIVVSAVDPAAIPHPRRRTAVADLRPVLRDGRARVIGALPDGPFGVCRGAPQAHLARELSVRLFDRLRI